MPAIKKHLIETIQQSDIRPLLDEVENHYRVEDQFKSSWKLYGQITDVLPVKKKFSDEFLDLVYETLEAWGMNSRGARLLERGKFKQSLIDNREAILSLAEWQLEKVSDKNEVPKTLEKLLGNLHLVDTNSPLVTWSKTLHFFLPNLLMPIDREYTLTFFYNRATNDILKDEANQIQLYLDIFGEFRQFARKYAGELKGKPNSRWLKNIPKNIDNILIGYDRKNNCK